LLPRVLAVPETVSSTAAGCVAASVVQQGAAAVIICQVNNYMVQATALQLAFA